MARITLLLAFAAAASAFHQGIAAPRFESKLAVSRVAPSHVVMEEPSEKATVIGAAAVGGLVGVYLFKEISVRALRVSKDAGRPIPPLTRARMAVVPWQLMPASARVR